MKTISLTKGRVALVDDVDYLWLSKMRWCYSSDGYATNYYADEHGQRHRRGIRRMIMDRILGGPIPRNLSVDHINHDRLDSFNSLVPIFLWIWPFMDRSKPNQRQTKIAAYTMG